MFNKDSLFFTLTISFIVSILLIIISFFIVVDNIYLSESEKLKQKYLPIARMVHKSCNQDGYNSQLATTIKNMDMSVIRDEEKIEELFKNKTLKTIFTRDDRAHGVKLLSDGEYHYLFIKTPQELFLIKDRYKIQNNTFYIFVVFLAILVSVILSYLTMIRKLYPLKKLKDKVKDMANEDFKFECFTTKSKDEVSLLANEFKQTAIKLQNIKDARNIFIRNIMHELKTPITKGKFLIELQNEPLKDEKLKAVFYRLESLINEFATIEEVISTSKKIEFKEYFIEDIIDNSIDMLMCDSEDIAIDIKQSIKLNVNLKLFSIAIKNLIDNGIKYSLNNKVIVQGYKDKIIFINSGKKLQNELTSYFEPFSKDDKFSNDSFGLGLYIVHSILDVHNCHLDYYYKNEKNYFTIKLKRDDER